MTERDTWQAIQRGMHQKCPACGEGSLYKSYLKVADTCPQCGEELHHQRADDAPAYFTMFIIGHIVVGAVMTVESHFEPALWVHALIWPPILLGMSLFLLPRVKGVLIGVQWAKRMHGFDAPSSPVLSPAPKAAG